MGRALYTNNASARLLNPVAPGDLSLTLASGQGAMFPTPAGGDYFYLTLTDFATYTRIEIVTCTARSGDVLTVTRASQGTSAQSWLSGDVADLRDTAYGFSELAPLGGSNSFNAVLSTGVFSGTYSDGVVIDYLSPNGRISVGAADNIIFYTNGIANTAMMQLALTGMTGTAVTATFASPQPIGSTTPAAGTFTSLSSTSGALNGTVGATTPSTGAFTTLSASGVVSGVGFSNYLASPPAIGGTTPAAGSFTTLSKGGVSVPSNTSTDTLTNKTLLANGPNTVEATSAPGSSALSSRNRVDNGAFLISQRYGVSSQSLTAGTTVPAADRWLVNISTVNGTFLVSAAAGPNGDQLDNYLVISGAAGSTNPQWFTRMESQRTRDLASRPIVISFWAIQNSGSSLPISAAISRANSTDNFSGVTGDNAVTCTPSTIPNGVWTKVTGVVTLTAAATTGLQLGILITGTVGATASAIAQVQLEQGSVATPFEWEHPQQTLAKCQRYLPVISLPAAATYVGPATISSVTAGVVLLPFQVPARVVPTAASIPLTTGFTVQNTANSTSTAAVFNAATSTTTGAIALTFVGATTGGGICYNTGANNIVFTGAEL